jgi:3-oxoacyl-[acyl-carrier protein] reductase
VGSVTIAVVTGAASGIGAAIARRIAGPGVSILLHTRKNDKGLATVAATASALGAKVETTLSDLSLAGAGTRLVETALDRFSGLDWVIANAGFADKRAISDLPDDGIQASFAPIVDSFFQIARAASPALRKSPQGRVVAISSFVAHRFPPKGDLFPASAAAKAALEALARALAAEMASDGVTVNIVAPGYTQKDPGAHAALNADRWREIMDRIPLSRLARPEDCAAAVAYFLSEDAGYVTGQTMHVDGGLSL